jgi:hypothetical protein
LCMWLTQVDRDTSPDAPWIREVRRCILGRSELIWERVKGALGVPPELDVEDFSLRVHEDVFDDDDGESSHWGDWDSMEQSPIQVERPGALEMDDSRVAQTQAYPIVVNEAVRPTENLDSCSPTQDDLGKSDEITTHAHVTPVCAVSQTCAYTYPYPYSHLSIEPLMADAPSAESASGMPSLSLSVSGTHATDPVVGEGLQDIAEGAEEEEPDDGEQDKPSVDTQGRGELESEEKGLNASLIHGLRISTAPSHGPPLVLSPRSPMPSYSRPQSDAGVGSRVSSRSTSFSSLGGASASSHLGIARGRNTFQSSPVNILQAHSSSHSDSPLAISGHLNNTAVLHHLGLKRSASLTSSIGRRGSFKRTESFSSLRAGSTWRGDVPYDPVAERGPGSPLFPSNFTKLTLEPTLSAKWVFYLLFPLRRE